MNLQRRVAELGSRVPRAVKRARHNSYRVKKPDEPASIRHTGPATVNLRGLKPRPAA